MQEKTALKRLKGFGEVENMTSSNGNDVPNQFKIYFDNGKVLKSYNSIIVVKLENKIYLGRNWDYSVTTGKYRNQFLGETKKETEQKIKDGTYKILS